MVDWHWHLILSLPSDKATTSFNYKSSDLVYWVYNCVYMAKQAKKYMK